MKVLYAVQGTGNGHICRAQDIIPVLDKKVDLDVVVSGTQSDIKLPRDIKYQFKGLSFIFGKKGGVDVAKTWKSNKIKRFYQEVKTLPVENYDLVISDFEPISAWACYMKKVPCLGLSHQAAVLHKNAPQPNHFDPMGKTILKYYAPVTKSIGFHFKKYSKKIYTPVIRNAIRSGKISNEGHYVVYLPSYKDEKLERVLSNVKGVFWHVFSKHCTRPYVSGNIVFRPVTNDEFVESMLSSEGVLCGAGFETPAEALFLKKKLMVIPMKRQYEQHCNAAALKDLGVPVLKKLNKKYSDLIQDWVAIDQPIVIDFKVETEDIINNILENYTNMSWKEKELTVDEFVEQKLRGLEVNAEG